MRTLAIELPGIGEPETLRTITRELPDPGTGEVRLWLVPQSAGGSGTPVAPFVTPTFLL